MRHKKYKSTDGKDDCRRRSTDYVAQTQDFEGPSVHDSIMSNEFDIKLYSEVPNRELQLFNISQQDEHTLSS